FGPYQAQDATNDIFKIAMVAVGLHLDRIQGLFFQAPIFVLGVLGIAPCVAANRRLALLTGAVYLSLLLPSATHTNWYGGMSFAGRFFWSVVLLWVFPLLYAVRQLYQRGLVPLVWSIISGAVIIQSVFIAKVLIPNTYTYSAPLHRTAAWMDSNPYADFFDLSSIQRAQRLPSFQDVGSFAHAPANWIAFGLLGCLVYTGYCALRRDSAVISTECLPVQRMLQSGRSCTAVWAIYVAVAAGVTQFIQPTIYPEVLVGNNPATGVRQEMSDSGEYLIVRPHAPLQPGEYAITLDYTASKAQEQALSWDCVLVKPNLTRDLLTVGRLSLATTAPQHIAAACVIPKTSDRSGIFEFRLYEPRNGLIAVQQLTIQPIGD
ncbi:MAG: hypothetical protein HGA19_15985, partial [Oscillochloris sp.]|nr:hypothetical protein [Oscillochloris sp.]